jgi:hypothetical protein
MSIPWMDDFMKSCAVPQRACHPEPQGDTMSWITDIKNQLQDADKQKREFDIQCRKEYLRLTPIVMGLLKSLGKEWYGKLFFVKRYKIEVLPGVFFWGIKRRGRGLDLLPQRLNLKLRVTENNVYFAIDAAFADGPTISVNTSDTSEESLKQAIVELISRT